MMFCIFGIYTFFFCDKFIKITLESKKVFSHCICDYVLDIMHFLKKVEAVAKYVFHFPVFGVTGFVIQMNEIEMADISGVGANNNEGGGMSVRSTDALITENGITGTHCFFPMRDLLTIYLYAFRSVEDSRRSPI